MGEPTWVSDILAEMRRPRVPIAILFACLFYLLVPESLLNAVGPGVASWAAASRPWIFATALVFGALLLYDVVHAIVGAISTQRKRGQIRTLGSQEREQLALWMKRGIVSGSLDMMDGIGESLVRREILSFTGRQGPRMGIYILQPWARDYLTKHPEVLTNDQPAARGT